MMTDKPMDVPGLVVGGGQLGCPWPLIWVGEALNVKCSNKVMVLSITHDLASS